MSGAATYLNVIHDNNCLFDKWVEGGAGAAGFGPPPVCDPLLKTPGLYDNGGGAYVLFVVCCTVIVGMQTCCVWCGLESRTELCYAFSCLQCQG
jgi:hypothetical protein